MERAGANQGVWVCTSRCACVGVHVWVCMCGCACVGVHVWVCMCGCTCVGVHVWVCMCGCACVGVHVWVYMCGCACVGMHVWVCMCGCAYTKSTFLLGHPAVLVIGHHAVLVVAWTPRCWSCNDVLFVTRASTFPVDLMLVSYTLVNGAQGMRSTLNRVKPSPCVCRVPRGDSC